MKNEIVDNCLKVTGNCYIFIYNPKTEKCILQNSCGHEIMQLPASVKVSSSIGELSHYKNSHIYRDDTLILTSKSNYDGVGKSEFRFKFFDNYIIAEYELTTDREVAVYDTTFFQKDYIGIYMPHCTRYFTPSPRSYGNYYKNFPDCSLLGYFAPPPLFFCAGGKNGMVMFGLADLPDSYEYKLNGDLGILVERPAGHKFASIDNSYVSPRMIIGFPEEEWKSPELFRELLEDVGTYKLTRIEDKNLPEWWKRPTVCTYGDQMMDMQYNWYSDRDWSSPNYNSNWLMDWLDNAEKSLGNTEFTIIIDAFWQHRYSAVPYPDQVRFKNLRQIIDIMHERGHKVLLWWIPFIEREYDEFESLARKYGILTDQPVRQSQSGFNIPNAYHLDFTAPRTREYLAAVSAAFFGNGENQLDADGLKMDFLRYIRRPEDAKYSDPTKGIGIKELYNFYKIFNEEAKKVKPDVLLNGSAADPRFEDLLGMNRLHDIQHIPDERQTRARLSSLSAPNLMIDSDGAIMISDWVENEYLCAVLYSTPSLYYIKQFHDGVSLRDKIKSIGDLLSLSAKKPWGIVEYESFGNWKLISNGKVVGRTFDSRTIILYDEKGKGYIFTWDSGKQRINLLGRKVKTVLPTPAELHIEEDYVTAEWKAGKIYELHL